MIDINIVSNLIMDDLNHLISIRNSLLSIYPELKDIEIRVNGKNHSSNPSHYLIDKKIFCLDPQANDDLLRDVFIHLLAFQMNNEFGHSPSFFTIYDRLKQRNKMI